MSESKIESGLIKNGDCIEISFTGFVDGKPFDSNIAEDLKKINSQTKPEKTILFVGKRMVVPGLDDSFIGKSLNKKYSIKIPCSQGFGPRRTSLVKTIPLKVFAGQKVYPTPGAAFVFDNQLARVIAVSGARVITDFNNPLAGKDLEYHYTITNLVTDLKERTETACKLLFRFVPETAVSGNEVTIKGPAILGKIIEQSQKTFKELIGTEILFQEAEIPKEEAQAPQS